MSSYTRFIPGEEIDSFKQWDFGSVNGDALLLETGKKEVVQAADQDKSHELVDEARAAGHAVGYAEGFVQGQAQVRLEAQRQVNDYMEKHGQESAQRFVALFLNAQAQLDDVEQVIACGVLELACELARQVVRQELTLNTKVLEPVIREAVRLLRAEHKGGVIKLNPTDFDVLHEDARTEFAKMALTVVSDVSVTQGGCLVEVGASVVDGRLEKRWLQAVSALGLTVPWGTPHDDE